MGFFGAVLTSIFLAVSVAFMWRMFVHLDLNKITFSHKPGVCRNVEGITDGSEDVVVLSNGMAVITSGLRYGKPIPELEGVTGKLYSYNFKSNATQPKANRIKIKWNDSAKEKNFNPHGMKAYVDSKGTTTLYVINHEPQEDTVELFEFDSSANTAKHVKTLRHELIYSANNLALVGPEEFYISNDRFFHNAFLSNVEFLIPIFKLGSIVYYNKGKASIADQFIFMPNGLDIDAKKKHLLVSSFLGKQLLLYTIEKDMAISRYKAIDLGSWPDNVVYDEKLNSAWIGCHPVAYQAMAYLLAPKTGSAPSQVLLVNFKNGFENYTIFDPYADDGTEVKASSVAIRYEKQILIGSVYDRLVLCNL